MTFPKCALVALGVLVVLVCSALSANAALMALERYAETVAGIRYTVGTTDGYTGTSLFSNGVPQAMCAYPSIASDADQAFIVGDFGRFRTFNRTDNYLGTYASVSYSGTTLTPVACSTAKYTSKAITYYVSGSNVLSYLTSAGETGAVTLTTGSAGGLSVTVSPNQDYVYALNQYNQLFRCRISEATPILSTSCTQIAVTGGTWPAGSSSTAGGVAVTNNNIFIATSLSINVYALDGTYVTSTGSGVNFVDVHTQGSDLYGVTSCAIYNVTLVSSVITTTVVGGNPSVCSNTDGLDGTFSGIFKVYPISQDEIYLAINTRSILRSFTVPPVAVAYAFPRPPFPVDFGSYEDGTLMGELYGYMDSDMQSVATGAAIDPASISVDPALWVTNMTIDVPQRVFDTDVTEAGIRALPFTQTANELTTYYDRTNELVYSDANLLPLCSVRQMRIVEHATAERASQLLQFPHIYTSTYLTPVASNPNISALKLLMPADFGYGNTGGTTYNATTHPLLEDQNFSSVILGAVTDSTPVDRRYQVTFNQPPASISTLSEAQKRMLRLLVQQTIKDRLDLCKLQWGTGSGGNSTGSGSGSGSGSGVSGGSGSGTCVPRVGITNMTERYPYSSNYSYNIFIPDDMDYNFNITQCLDGTDWTHIIDWINNQPRPSKRKCGTGCIVGVAVAAAVVAAFLIVLIVVLTSKRRRLATVVAPGTASASEPKFVSTYDDDDGRNPLDD